jgi:AcrR family transcriptional regulator
MDRIAERLGIAKPTLYHYVSSKEELLYDIHQEFLIPLIASHEARVGEGVAPRSLLLEAMADILQLMQTHAGHVRVFFENHHELQGERRATVHRQRDHYTSLIRNAVAEGCASGDFKQVDAELTTVALFGMCNWAYQWFKPSGRLQPRDVAEHFWTLLMSGIEAQP